MTMRPEDVAALFDLPPLPETSRAGESTAEAAEAEQASLAAEIAATIASGGFAADAPESRTFLRVDVSWPARMHLPDGRIIDVKVRNISEAGVGLLSDGNLPADTVVDFEMSVPQPDAGDKVTPVRGTIKTTYTVARGAQSLCGGTWQAPPAHLELVNMWIMRLRR